MCNCRKFNDGWLAGVRDGVMEVHSPDFCRKQRMASWWTRLLYAIGAWFTRRAGRDAAAGMAAYYEWEALWSKASPARRRDDGGFRAVLSDIYDRMEKDDE